MAVEVGEPDAAERVTRPGEGAGQLGAAAAEEKGAPARLEHARHRAPEGRGGREDVGAAHDAGGRVPAPRRGSAPRGPRRRRRRAPRRSPAREAPPAPTRCRPTGRPSRSAPRSARSRSSATALGVHAPELAAGDVQDLAVDVVGELGGRGRARGRPPRAGCAGRPSGMIIEAIARCCSGIPSSIFSPPRSIASACSLAWVRRVSTKPKATALTLTLNCPHSLAIVFVRPVTPGLGRRVVGLARVSHRPGDRGHVDDLAEPLGALPGLLLGRLAPVRRQRPDEAEGDDRVDVEHRLELLVAHLVDHAVPGVAGVVDDDVDLAEGLVRLRHQVVAGPRAWSDRRRTRRSRPRSRRRPARRPRRRCR